MHHVRHNKTPVENGTDVRWSCPYLLKKRADDGGRLLQECDVRTCEARLERIPRAIHESHFAEQAVAEMPLPNICKAQLGKRNTKRIIRHSRKAICRCLRQENQTKMAHNIHQYGTPQSDTKKRRNSPASVHAAVPTLQSEVEAR